MKLTKQTDFALRTLMYLSQDNITGLVSAREISASYDIPLNHLTKIVNKLSQLGYIKTYRGRNGGIKLGKDKAQISIKSIVEDFESSLNLVACHNCNIQTNCLLQEHLHIANQAFLQSLASKTLADIAP